MKQDMLVKSLDDYSDAAMATAVYPGRGANLFYPAMGVAGEAAELLEKVEALHKAYSDQSRVGVLMEAGDVLWFLNALTYEADCRLDNSINRAMENTWITHASLADASRRISVHAGQCAGIVSKVMRDSSGKLTAEKRLQLSAHVGHCLLRIDNIARTLSSSFAEVAELNLAKLAGRKVSGTIHGSGDAR